MNLSNWHNSYFFADVKFWKILVIERYSLLSGVRANEHLLLNVAWRSGCVGTLTRPREFGVATLQPQD